MISLAIDFNYDLYVMKAEDLSLSGAFKKYPGFSSAKILLNILLYLAYIYLSLKGISML